jgi:YD repeat-containing protein
MKSEDPMSRRNVLQLLLTASILGIVAPKGNAQSTSRTVEGATPEPEKAEAKGPAIAHPYGHTTTYHYDAGSRLVKISYGDGSAVRYEYRGSAPPKTL